MPNRIKLLNIVGARPQIIKSAAISRAISGTFSDSISEVILHTGQHYDNKMSDVFFDELSIPKPHYNLNVGSASHGKQTALMITGIEEVLVKEGPDAVIIYGDTNSTLSAAIAASKIHIPLIHIEAGLRSYKKTMPEEVNRVMSDHVSTLLFAPTESAFNNLIREGMAPDNRPPYSIDNPKVFLTGDIMYDNSMFYSELAEQRFSNYLEENGLEHENYILVTIHRADNTDLQDNLLAILESLIEIAELGEMPLVLPLHPRTLNAIEKLGKKITKSFYENILIKVIPPVSFLEMIMLEKHCTMIITDSGGVQKESHFFKKPSIVLREVTEWVELVENGTTLLAGADKINIIEAYKSLSNTQNLSYPSFYGDGKASEAILKEILNLCSKT